MRPIKPNIEPILDRLIQFHVGKDLRMTWNICMRSTVDQNIPADTCFFRRVAFCPLSLD
jgi:hypothetical protein